MSRTINELLVVDGHGENSANEPEVFNVMFIAEPRVRVHLERVVVTVCVSYVCVVQVDVCM